MMPPSLSLEQAITVTVREEWGRILASLVKQLKDFQLAEDCLQDAVLTAMTAWAKTGIPKAPDAWLLTTARRRAIDRLRRDQSFSSKQAELSYLADLDGQAQDPKTIEAIPDERLEMIFTCCHPAIEEKSRIALTLRTLGGLTTEEIAAAFLDQPSAMAQRLVRAKKKIKLAGISYRIPEAADLPDRLSSVLHVLYLIFNEGYSARVGNSITRSDLTDEAIRLARIMRHLMPEETEVAGLLALMLHHDARRMSRISESGAMIPLDAQNRNRWDRGKIREGDAILHEILPLQRIGPYQLQAAISAAHNNSASWQDTDWADVAGLYGLLYGLQPSPVVRINQAMAVSYWKSPALGLSMLEAARGASPNEDLGRYQPYYAARADLLARLGRGAEAKAAYQTAIELSDNAEERAFLTRKALEMS